MGDSDNRNAQILGGSTPFWICAIVVIANTSKETADAIGLEYMYEYILTLLIVSSVIIGSICVTELTIRRACDSGHPALVAEKIYWICAIVVIANTSSRCNLIGIYV